MSMCSVVTTTFSCDPKLCHGIGLKSLKSSCNWLFTTCIQHEPTTSKQCPVMALLFYCFEIISSTPANGCTFRPNPCFSKMTCAVAWAKDMQVPPMAHGMEECKDMLKADAGKATKWLRVCSTFSQDSRLLDWT